MGFGAGALLVAVSTLVAARRTPEHEGGLSVRRPLDVRFLVMSEAATVRTFEGGRLADIPALKLYVVRSSARQLDAQDQAMLDLLEVSFVRRWAEALADVAPERADRTAVRLWAETKSAWAVYSPRLTKLAQRELQTEAPMVEVLPDLVEAHIDQILEHLPHLSASARIYVHAFLDVLKPVLDSDEVQEGIGMVMDGNWPDDPRFDEYMALLHGLAVAGFQGGIPDVVVTALATGFWARLRALAQDDDEELERIDAALSAALRRARTSKPIVHEEPRRTKSSVLERLREAASGADQIWAAQPRDAATNLDKYLYGQ